MRFPQFRMGCKYSQCGLKVAVCCANNSLLLPTDSLNIKRVTLKPECKCTSETTDVFLDSKTRVFRFRRFKYSCQKH